MRTFIWFIILALFLAPMSQIQSQNTCGACVPNTTGATLAALKARMDSVNKRQDARIASLQALRTKMQEDIRVLSEKLLDLNSRSMTDTSVTNELARYSVELTGINSQIREIIEHQEAMDREAKARASERLNEDIRYSAGLTNGQKWAIGGGVVAVVGTTLYFVGRNSGWWGGKTTNISVVTNTCVGVCK